MAKGPVLIDLDGESADVTPQASVADAPPVPDFSGPLPAGQAMQIAARLGARRPSTLGRWFWALLMALVMALVSLAMWRFLQGLLEQYPVLGLAMSALTVLFLFVLGLIALKEIAAFRRLTRIDGLRHAANDARIRNDLSAARAVLQRLAGLYDARPDTKWGRERLQEHEGTVMDARDLLGLAETHVLGALDQAASREIEAAARQVATVTALVPLALADVAAALTANLRMIRRISEIYGGRSGTLGNWRLTRAVMSHLVATGAVAVGDDLLEPVLGGSLLGKLSRRFGEGLVNGALTARVGVAAMEVCRPLPFDRAPRPSVRSLVQGSLKGLFNAATPKGDQQERGGGGSSRRG